MARRPEQYPFSPPEEELPRLAVQLRQTEAQIALAARLSELRWRMACERRRPLRRIGRAMLRFVGVRHA